MLIKIKSLINIFRQQNLTKFPKSLHALFPLLTLLPPSTLTKSQNLSKNNLFILSYIFDKVNHIYLRFKQNDLSIFTLIPIFFVPLKLEFLGFQTYLFPPNSKLNKVYRKGARDLKFNVFGRGCTYL